MKKPTVTDRRDASTSSPLLLQEGLRTAYISLVHALGREGIMHLPAEAGVFMMLDLREYLEDSTEVSIIIDQHDLRRTFIFEIGLCFYCIWKQ